MNIYCDGHCDTLKNAYDENKDLKFESYDFNLVDAKMNKPVIQNLASFVHTNIENGFERAKNIIKYYFSNISGISLITNKQELDKKLFIQFHQDIPYSKKGQTHLLK